MKSGRTTKERSHWQATSDTTRVQSISTFAIISSDRMSWMIQYQSSTLRQKIKWQICWRRLWEPRDSSSCAKQVESSSLTHHNSGEWECWQGTPYVCILWMHVYWILVIGCDSLSWEHKVSTDEVQLSSGKLITRRLPGRWDDKVSCTMETHRRYRA